MKNKLITYIIVLSFVIPQITSAQIPFGGRIVMVQECFCSGGWMMYIWDQYTKGVIPILFQFGVSGLKSNYNIWIPGVQTLGSYTIGGSCTTAVSSCYVTIPAVGTVSPSPLMPGIGTSLY
jgi:hypothetical protein